ncbi:MAG: hypothetical protein U0790_29430 [Isosphaeraceae bacterium]
MDAVDAQTMGRDRLTEERLRKVTALCVASLIVRGVDSATVRLTVLRMATTAIRELSSDAYQEETHIAVVQRTIDQVLSLKSHPA